jgi:hypothetical protein
MEIVLAPETLRIDQTRDAVGGSKTALRKLSELIRKG